MQSNLKKIQMPVGLSRGWGGGGGCRLFKLIGTYSVHIIYVTKIKRSKVINREFENDQNNLST